MSYPSYYPTERRGGCMESITRCCRTAYVYPIDTRKLLYAGGGLVGVILIAVIWSGLSSSESSAYVQPFKGSKVLLETPLIVGSNFFPVNLRNLVQNNISRVDFTHNLSNDSVFGNANCKSCQTDLARLQSGLVGSQVWSLHVPCYTEYKDAVSLTLEQVDAMSRLLARYKDNITVIRASNDVAEGFRHERVGGLLAVTSGHSFDGRMSVLRTLYSLGVRVMGITSNCSNAWAAGYNDISKDKDGDPGLTDFGKAVVREMNRLGMVIDLSEASHQTQLGVLNVTRAPVVFTRAAAHTLANHTRNIQDDVLQQLSKTGGLVMVTFATQYLGSTNVSISDVIKHINYIKNITGVDKVGIGAEFDAEGETYPSSLSDVSKFPTLFDKLGDEKWSENDLKKLAGENFLQLLKKVEEVAENMSSVPADESFKLPITSICYSDYSERSNASTTVPTSPPPAAPTNSTPTTIETSTTTVTTPTTPTTVATTNTTVNTNTTLPANSTAALPKP